MSQRSRSQRIVKFQSQSSQSRQSQVVPQTPQTQTQSVPNELIQKCVRYFLLKMNSNVPVKRAQIIQALYKEKPGRSLDHVIKQAAYILEQDYGLKLQIIDKEAGGKKYLVVNNLKKPDLVLSEDKLNDLQSVVTFLVLTHVFMSKNCATEASLWEFLKGVNIFPEQKLSDYGTVSLFVQKQLVKEQYVHFETVGSANEDGEIKKKLSWGSRAETCVSKMEILKFVAKMYGNVNVKSWTCRYEDAIEQFPERQTQENIVEE